MTNKVQHLETSGWNVEQSDQFARSTTTPTSNVTDKTHLSNSLGGKKNKKNPTMTIKNKKLKLIADN